MNLAAHIAEKIGGIYHINRTQLEILVKWAIAEHEKAHDAEMKGPLCVHCGKCMSAHTVSFEQCVDADGLAVSGKFFTPAIEPEYRMLEVGEMIERGDEYSNCEGEWNPVLLALIGDPLADFSVGHYRRKTTPIQPLLDNPHLVSFAAQKASSDGDREPRNPADEPATEL